MNKVTSISTIMGIVLRELREERGLHAAHVSDYLKCPLVAWRKIEAGDGRLTLARLYDVCVFFKIQPSEVIKVTDGYAMFLRSRGWLIISGQVSGLADGPDLLAAEAKKYYDTRPDKSEPQTPVMSGPSSPWAGYSPRLVFDYVAKQTGNTVAPTGFNINQ